MLEVIALYNGQVTEVAQLKEVIGWRCPRYLQVRIPVMIDQVIRPDSRQLYVTREWKIVGPIHLNQPKNEEAGDIRTCLVTTNLAIEGDRPGNHLVGQITIRRR